MTKPTSKPTPRPTPDSDRDPATDPAPAPGPGGPLHLYVLLDRSGSMEAIRAEVIGGFNAFVAGQQVNGADARLTLVQFDTQDLAETVIDDVPVRRVTPLTRARFQPRGGTPLLDATAHLVARARAAVGDGPAGRNVVVVTITDGLENASREFTRADIREVIGEREAAGWTFVYLSAGLDAYDDATSFGYAPGSVQAWAPDAEGATLAFASLDVAVTELRTKVRRAAPLDPHQVFGGRKPAEVDRRRKRGDAR
jgi:hypothetical protein